MGGLSIALNKLLSAPPNARGPDTSRTGQTRAARTDHVSARPLSSMVLCGLIGGFLTNLGE